MAITSPSSSAVALIYTHINMQEGNHVKKYKKIGTNV